MNIKILIEKNLFLSKIAVLQDEEWTSYYLDSHLEKDLQNQVVVGEIKQVVKHLNGVFVDFNDDRNGLLHIKQIPKVYQDKLYPGSRMPVQIIKQNSGEKGNKLTGMVNLSGRFLVCLPFEKGIHLSKKINNEEKRRQIISAIEEVCGQQYGFIVRTHAKDVPIARLQQDALELMKIVQTFMKTKDCLSKGTVLYKEPPLAVQVILEYLDSGEPLEVICNDEAYLKELKAWIGDYEETKKISYIHFSNHDNMFHIYDLQKKVDELLHRKIWLKNGGNLMIDYTEAMSVIDVNSAKAVLSKKPQKAVLDLNILAVRESILQILRRNLSGIILIDLVEMTADQDRQSVYEYAKAYIASLKDTRTKIYPLTELGLMQISRTKRYKSLHQQLLERCPQCHAPYGEHTFIYCMQEIEYKIRDLSYHTDHRCVILQVNTRIYEKLQKEHLVEALEEKYGISLDLQKLDQNSKSMFLCQLYKR